MLRLKGTVSRKPYPFRNIRVEDEKKRGHKILITSVKEKS